MVVPIGQSLSADVVAARPAIGVSVASKRRPPVKKLHTYFVIFTAVFGLLVIAGFTRTFFVPVAQGTFVRPVIVHVHGALFFGWTALLFLQALLAATKRLRLHRKIGSFAGWLIVPMLALGTIVAARDTVHDFRAGEGDAALSFFYGELADLAMFGLLAGAAMLMRNKPDYHKRWVIMGSLGLLGAAIGRIPEIRDNGLEIFVGLIVSVGLYDLVSRRAVHLATVIGAATLLIINLTEVPIGNTRVWISEAHHLLSV